MSNENNNNDAKTASERVRRILTPAVDLQTLDDVTAVHLDSHSLFAQLDVLSHFSDGRLGWKEVARWLKYEETVETGGRWSKPHVPTAQMHALIELRKAFADGRCATGLGVTASTSGPYEVADALIDTLRKELKLSENVCQRIRATILNPHKHKHRKTDHKKKSSTADPPNGQLQRSFSDASVCSVNDEFGTHITFGTQASVMSQHDDHKKKHFLRRRSGDGSDIAAVYHSYPEGANPDNLAPYKPNRHMGKKLPKGCESANLMVGQVDYLTEPVMAFIRLDKQSALADLTEVDVPVRFMFLILGPIYDSNIWEYQEMGRIMAVLLSDKVFCDVAYKVSSRDDIVAGIDEFMDGLTVLPPSIWDPSTRLEPPSHSRSMDQIMMRLDEKKRKGTGPTAPPQEEGASDDVTLNRTGRIFGGLVRDMRQRYRHYLSDIKDGIHIQCLASVVFLFFACITPIVTFGGLMGQKTDGYMGTMETIVSGAICGLVYAIFSGQPLTIIGATGPLLIFESILYSLCKDNSLDFMSFRFWIGTWVVVALFLIVAFDLSALVQYITRFTEESFAILISVIFIYEAFDKIYEIQEAYMIHTGTNRESDGYRCFCNYAPCETELSDGRNCTFDERTLPEECLTFSGKISVNTRCLSSEHCVEHGWNLTGPACHDHKITESVPDVFFLSLMLFLGTFCLAYFFRIMRTSRYFPSRVRSTFADFAVFMSVVIFTGIDYAFGIKTPKLTVPEKFDTTIPGRGWFINPANVTYWWLILLAIVPAILATILVFLDQQITAVIVNRKEHKLKKGHGYHLDLLVVAILIFVCSILGLPWFVAATVRAITHVKSLIRVSEASVPGERPQMLGVREQRVTGICIHLLIGVSILLTSVLKLIPMPVLYGVFLYMGVTSLGGVQFFERVLLMFMPMKYQPDYVFLRHVRTSRVYVFTVIQLICFGCMWAVKTIKETSIAFPIMLIALMAVRKLLDYVFTQGELYWLDHLLPEEHRRHKEDAAKAIEEGNLRSFSSFLGTGDPKQGDGLKPYSFGPSSDVKQNGISEKKEDKSVAAIYDTIDVKNEKKEDKSVEFYDTLDVKF